MIYRLVRPLVFSLDPERAHDLTMDALATSAPGLGLATGHLRLRDARLAQRIWGRDFPNPVGLAAGFDKRARAVPAWEALGFGFAEMGTVTALPQPGGPKPRVFRLPVDRAIVNRLGFNNDGASATAARLARGRRSRIPLGINIGKSRAAPLSEAPADYLASFERLRPHADYVVVNVSSPNTPGLRELQDRAPLEAVLRTLIAADERLAATAGDGRRPLLVKIAPDLEAEAVDEVVDLALELGLAGLVISNTTLAREGLASPPRLVHEAGGLSGLPLRGASTAVLRRAASRAVGRLTLIGVGGVFDADDAWAKLAAGAALVQVYTGLVYEGPSLVARINRGILRRMDRERIASVADLVGRDLP